MGIKKIFECFAHKISIIFVVNINFLGSEIFMSDKAGINSCPHKYVRQSI